MLVGGLWELRNGNLFGATFRVGYACFLVTTPMQMVHQIHSPTHADSREPGLGAVPIPTGLVSLAK
ncbi:MAG: hypothetical protein QOI29_2183 [Mycobacterium sp.]|jgi:succinate-acetate transporter protein|nr:hypothetical protein [Mycobacterium sp.]